MLLRLIPVLVTLLASPAVWAHDLAKAAESGQATAGPSEAAVIPFAQAKVFTMNGNSLQGLATRASGVNTHEVWRSSVMPGGSTPVHTHTSEEVFVVLSGEGIVRVGDLEIPFKAPCTIIAPAGVPHQIVNTGEIPSESIVIVTAGSEIRNTENEVMELPWRQ